MEREKGGGRRKEGREEGKGGERRKEGAGRIKSKKEHLRYSVIYFLCQFNVTYSIAPSVMLLFTFVLN